MNLKNNISNNEFRVALFEIETMSPIDRVKLQKELKSSPARGYFVRTTSGNISMKLVIRLAYLKAGTPWKQGEGLQSKEVYERFKSSFPLFHEPKARRLNNHQLNSQEKVERAYVSRLKRRGQAKFRRKLLDLDPTCALTACRAVNALEAAHIQPAADNGDYRIDNGLLLRADLHRLFDLGYLAVHPKTGQIWLHKSCLADYQNVVASSVIPIERLLKSGIAFRQRWKCRIVK